jgi:hypothetical protein
MIIKSIVRIQRQVSAKLIFLDIESHLTAPKHYRYLVENYAAITILNKAWVILNTKTSVFHYCLNNTLFYLNNSLYHISDRYFIECFFYMACQI